MPRPHCRSRSRILPSVILLVFLPSALLVAGLASLGLRRAGLGRVRVLAVGGALALTLLTYVAFSSGIGLLGGPLAFGIIGLYLGLTGASVEYVLTEWRSALALVGVLGIAALASPAILLLAWATTCNGSVVC